MSERHSPRNLRLLLEYQGTRYRGFQFQPGEKTIIGELQQAVKKALREDPKIFGAGRTDAGVHALGQVANFHTRSRLSPTDIREAVNDALPKDIAILRVDDVDAAFHARHSARERIYLYRITTRRSAFLKELSWWVRSKLDVEAMRAAGKELVGRRNFSSFADASNLPEDPVLTLFDVAVDREGTLVETRFRAERFLARMVRRMVGALVAVGQGKLHPSAVPDLFDRPIPEIAAWTAPPAGLYLEAVLYDEKASAAPGYKGSKGGAEGPQSGGILVWRP